MVEIWRWPYALFSVSLTACTDTPSRAAFSRSIFTNSRAPPSCASEATSRNSGSRPICAASLLAHSVTSAELVPVRLYWNCARLLRVVICTSCTDWNDTLTPGMSPTSFWSLAMTCGAPAARSSRGFSTIVSRPVLAVRLEGPTPITDAMADTSGSRCMVSATRVCNSRIRSNDTLGSAWVTAVISPVSCTGRKPLGTMT